nr:M23 family metallopeptidase [uncultured Sphaerochaeta sp.]
MWQYRVWVFSNRIKYIGIFAYVLSMFLSHPALHYLTLLSLFVVVEIALQPALFFGSVMQLLGMLKLGIRHRFRLPDPQPPDEQCIYDLPFEGSWVVVNGGPVKEFSHSWNIPVQRYAYDVVQMDETCATFQGDERSMESYYCYGKPILCPADGVVVKVVDTNNDSLILGKGRYFCRAKHIAGNHLVIKHSEDRYTVLAHLKKGSICVSKGEYVLRGQKVACCGNTGNSSEPHLHFHMQNTKSFHSSYGLPLRFSHCTCSPCPGYEKSDSRPLQDGQSLPFGYISRGYTVQNTRKEEPDHAPSGHRASGSEHCTREK